VGKGTQHTGWGSSPASTNCSSWLFHSTCSWLDSFSAFLDWVFCLPHTLLEPLFEHFLPLEKDRAVPSLPTTHTALPPLHALPNHSHGMPGFPCTQASSPLPMHFQLTPPCYWSAPPTFLPRAMHHTPAHCLHTALSPSARLRSAGAFPAPPGGFNTMAWPCLAALLRFSTSPAPTPSPLTTPTTRAICCQPAYGDLQFFPASSFTFGHSLAGGLNIQIWCHLRRVYTHTAPAAPRSSRAIVDLIMWAISRWDQTGGWRTGQDQGGTGQAADGRGTRNALGVLRACPCLLLLPYHLHARAAG